VNILNNYFQELSIGRLKRLPYLGYQLLLSVFIFTFIVLTIILMGVGEHIVSGDLEHAQNTIREWFTLPFLFVFALFMGAVCFSYVNIAAKRIRDTGLPGWITLVIVLLLEFIAVALISEQASYAVHMIFSLFILFTPSDQFKSLRK